MQKYIIGIDEAGRGPLAGPVAVCALAVEQGFDVKRAFRGVRDSKIMTARDREAVYEKACVRKEKGDIRFAVALGSVQIIDAEGITAAVQGALDGCLVELSLPAPETHIYLDGLLHAPAEYPQETVIHGDALIAVISLASVIAKVSRDALMQDLAEEYPQYGFERHKGYGTEAHVAALRAHGPSPVHRRSFLSRILRPIAVP